jgi:hypothetical protein
VAAWLVPPRARSDSVEESFGRLVFVDGTGTSLLAVEVGDWIPSLPSFAVDAQPIANDDVMVWGGLTNFCQAAGLPLTRTNDRGATESVLLRPMQRGPAVGFALSAVTVTMLGWVVALLLELITRGALTPLAKGIDAVVALSGSVIVIGFWATVLWSRWRDRLSMHPDAELRPLPSIPTTPRFRRRTRVALSSGEFVATDSDGSELWLGKATQLVLVRENASEEAPTRIDLVDERGTVLLWLPWAEWAGGTGGGEQIRRFADRAGLPVRERIDSRVAGSLQLARLRSKTTVGTMAEIRWGITDQTLIIMSLPGVMALAGEFGRGAPRPLVVVSAALTCLLTLVPMAARILFRKVVDRPRGWP